MAALVLSSGGSLPSSSTLSSSTTFSTASSSHSRTAVRGGVLHMQADDPIGGIDEKTVQAPPPSAEVVGSGVPASNPLSWATDSQRIPSSKTWSFNSGTSQTREERDQQMREEAAIAAVERNRELAKARRLKDAAAKQAEEPLGWATNAYVMQPSPTWSFNSETTVRERYSTAPGIERPRQHRKAASRDAEAFRDSRNVAYGDVAPKEAIGMAPVADGPVVGGVGSRRATGAAAAAAAAPLQQQQQPPQQQPRAVAPAPVAPAPVAAPALTSSLDERIAQARANCETAIEQRARHLVQEAMEEYFQDEIDEEELKSRKKAASKLASAQNSPRNLLDKACGAYEAAATARTEAEKAIEVAQRALEEAVRAEGEAAIKVDATLREIEAMGE